MTGCAGEPPALTREPRMLPRSNQTAPFEVAEIFAGGALDHFDGELEQANFPRFIYPLNDRAVCIPSVLHCAPRSIDDRLQGSAHCLLGDGRFAKLEPVAQYCDLPRLFAQTFH